MTPHSSSPRIPNVCSAGIAEANNAVAFGSIPSLVEQVNQPAQEGSPWPHYLAGMVQQTNQRLQLFAATHSLSSPLLEEVFESLQFVFGEPQFTRHSVYENAEENQCRHRTLLLVGCHRRTKVCSITLTSLAHSSESGGATTM